uniref:Protocadherin-16 n=1 Tax=Macrostomum lignano TaxID=282301 RepID=A0A1I8G692_9PLAT
MHSLDSQTSTIIFLMGCCLTAFASTAAAETIEIRFEDVLDGSEIIGSLPERLPPHVTSRFPGWSAGRGVACQLDSRLAKAGLQVDSRGTVRASGGLDRERICPPSSPTADCGSPIGTADACNVSGSIRVQDTVQPGNYQDVIVHLFVRDVDNKQPKFLSPYPAPFVTLIAENAPFGHRLGLPSAEDPDDSGRATCRLSYSLVNCSSGNPSEPGTFRLTLKAPKLRSPQEPLLELARRLDAEQGDAYRLCVTAADVLSSSGFTATLTVSVRVLDVNDNAPVWTPSQKFSVSVPEANPPEVLLRLSATDADRDFGVVTYRLLREHRLFSLNNRGELRLRTFNGLDYEQPSDRQHRLVAAAVDNGANGDVKSVTATLTVNVLDSNDNPPEILALAYSVELAENGPTPTPVQRLFVSDRDSGRNAMVSCSLMPQASGLFELALVSNKSTERVEYELQLVRQLDRETGARHRAEIRCIDAGEPPLSSEVSILVSVLDRNDNEPVFATSPLVVDVDEATPVGAAVHQFSVLDPDTDRHSLRAELVGDGADRFRVEARGLRTFVLVLALALDRETRDSFNLTAVVLDFEGGDDPANASEPQQPAHRTSSDLLIRVLDANDCAPRFQLQPSADYFAFATQENASVGTVVGNVTAKDADLGENGSIVYSLSPGSGAASFVIRPYTGQIRVARPLERDGPHGVSLHRLRVRATDRGRPFQRSAETDVLVTVIDTNDSRPRFVRPESERVVIDCREAVAGASLRGDLNVAAEDADSSPEHRRIRYRLAGPQQPAGPFEFSVQPHSGGIYLSRAPRPCRKGVYRLQLEIENQTAFTLHSLPQCFEPSSDSPDAPALPGRPARKTVTVELMEPESNQRISRTQPPLLPSLPTHLSEDGGLGDGGSFSSSMARAAAVTTLLTSGAVLLALLLIALTLRRCGKGRSVRSGCRRRQQPPAGERSLRQLSISSPRLLLPQGQTSPPQPPPRSDSANLLDYESVNNKLATPELQQELSYPPDGINLTQWRLMVLFRCGYVALEEISAAKCLAWERHAAVAGLAQRQFSLSLEADEFGDKNKYQSSSAGDFAREMTEFNTLKDVQGLRRQASACEKQRNAYQPMLPFSARDKNLYATCSPQRRDLVRANFAPSSPSKQAASFVMPTHARPCLRVWRLLLQL